MPTILRYRGVVIRMHYQQAEHNPPHVHVAYGGFAAIVDIRSREIVEGQLPTTLYASVRRWIENHETELLRMWDMQRFALLPPGK